MLQTEKEREKKNKSVAMTTDITSVFT